jgi:hypothetical protein
MVKGPLVDRVPLPDQTTFKNSLQLGYSEGLIFCKLLKVIYVRSFHCRNFKALTFLPASCEWSGSGSEKLYVDIPSGSFIYKQSGGIKRDICL